MNDELDFTQILAFWGWINDGFDHTCAQFACEISYNLT